MLETIIAFDKALFLKINTEWTAPFLDQIMPIWRDAKTWIFLYVLIVGWTVYKFGWRIWPWLLTIGLMMVFSDQFSSSLIKPWVARQRPCNDPEIALQVRSLLGYCRDSYSFMSSHAVNHFCIATFLIFTLKPYWGKMVYMLWFWAFSIAYGQVYVGVHFPVDITAGAITGCLFGYLFAKIFLKKIGMPQVRKLNTLAH